MVAFNFTPADEEVVRLNEEEKALAAAYLTTHDWDFNEKQPFPHPAFAGREESALAALRRLEDGSSGYHLVSTMLMMQDGVETLRMESGIVNLGTQIIQRMASPEQREKFGRLDLAISITEPGAGSDVANVRSSAVYDRATDEYVLNGEKIYCTGFGNADGAVALLRGEPDENGRRPFIPFVILHDTPGLEVIGRTRTMREKDGGPHWDYVMNDMRVPADHKLEGGFGAMVTPFNNTRSIVAAGCVYSSQLALAFTSKHLLDNGEQDYARGRANRSVAEERLLRMEALCEAAKLVVMHAKWIEDQPGNDPSSVINRVEASRAKALAGKAVREIPSACLELMGAQALSGEHELEEIIRDSRVFDIFEGAGEIQRLIVARDILNYSNRELN